MTPRPKALPTTSRNILMGKVHPQQKQFRIVRDVTAAESAEFGFLPLLFPLIGAGVGIYGQIKTAEAGEKAAKAGAEAAVRVAEAKAASRAETMRRLAPILGLAVVAGTLVTVVLIKKKKKGATS